MVTVQLLWVPPTPWCLPQPLASKKMPSRSCIMIFFCSPPPPSPPHILGKAEIREGANGGEKKPVCCFVWGFGVGVGRWGALPSREKRREGLKAKIKQIYKQSINWKWEKWVHFTLCLMCFTSFTPASLYFNTFLAYEILLLRNTFVPLCF